MRPLYPTTTLFHSQAAGSYDWPNHIRPQSEPSQLPSTYNVTNQSPYGGSRRFGLLEQWIEIDLSGRINP
jgi:hypothetical protein